MTNLTENTVLILGAGFTKAFFPDAPLLVDNYNNDALKKKFAEFPHALNILDDEIKRPPQNKIDIERLLTRVSSQMPYDNKRACHELNLLLLEIKSAFQEKIHDARRNESPKNILRNFAQLCIEKKTSCITFNYDDLFDQKLWEYNPLITIPEPTNQYWHPDGGYGFFCRPSEYMVCNPLVSMDDTAMLLLKLHGSINWRIRKGNKAPYTIDSIFHKEDWLTSIDPSTKKEMIELHLEEEPFFVPPLLSKDTLINQPVLRLIWSIAYEKLKKADTIVFIGYSLPTTDIAARFLFSETINSSKTIKIVNIGTAEKMKPFLDIFPHLTEQDDYFDGGAANWVKDVVTQNQPNIEKIKETNPSYPSSSSTA
jgi:hypothetical protein